MDCSPPGSSVHRLLQARILEWVALPFSRGIFPKPINISLFSSFSRLTETIVTAQEQCSSEVRAPACLFLPRSQTPVPCPPPCPQVDSSSAARPGAQVIAPCKQKQRDRAYKEAARLQGADGLREVAAEDQAWMVALGPQDSPLPPRETLLPTWAALRGFSFWQLTKQICISSGGVN